MTVGTLFLLWSLGCVTVGIVIGVVLTIMEFKLSFLEEAAKRSFEKEEVKKFVIKDGCY
jgi:hypothetical protein